MKTAIEIIDETIEFYSNNPRSVNYGGMCLYNGPNGEKCAFSRCMLQPEKAQENGSSTDVINFLAKKNDISIHFSIFDERIVPEGILKPEYDGHPVKFWLDIQHLHDGLDFWAKNVLDKNILTGQGHDEVEKLKNKYA